jgi:O-antigen/teichoic acid export membrane protein
VILAAVHPIVETFFPMASGLHAQRRAEDLSRLMIAGSKVATAIAAPIGIVLIFFGQPIMELWVPEAADEIPHGLMAAVVADYITSMYLWTATVILVAIGRTRLVVALTLIEIVLGVALMLTLAPRYGLIGIAIASFIANVLIGFLVQVPIAARAAHVTLGQLIGSAIGRVALACVPAVIVAEILRRSFENMSLFGLAASVCTVLLVYLVGIGLFGVRRDEREMLYGMLWKR